MASNITNRPKLVNGLANEIFNAGDFSEASNDNKYLKKTGGVLSGSLTVPSLITNGGIILQSVYPSLPTQTQLGGVFKSTTTTATTDTMRLGVNKYGTLSLPAGSYIIFTSFAFLNNVIPITVGTPPTYRATITFNNIQGGFSPFEGDTPNEFKTIQYYSQGVGDGGTITMNGSGFYQHKETTNKTVYMNCYVGVNNNCSVIANFTAVRVG